MDHNSRILEVDDAAEEESLDGTVAVHDQQLVHDAQDWEDHVTKLEEADAMLPYRLWCLHSCS